MSETPPNILEFNTIAGLILANLYKAHPVPDAVKREAIANAMGVGSVEEMLPSGRSFNTVFTSTYRWLVRERFVDDGGNNDYRAGACLAEKGLRAMTTASEGGFSLGENLVRASEGEDKGNYIARVMGNFFGSAVGAYQNAVQ